jgi:hypothetical protein
MLTDIRRALTVLFVSGGLLLVTAGTAQAAFNPLDEACTGTAVSSPACQDKNETDPITGPKGVILRVANVVALVAGVAAVVVMVVYGIMIVTSYGESGKVTQARNAIIGTAVGLVVIVLARTIVVFVVSKL